MLTNITPFSPINNHLATRDVIEIVPDKCWVALIHEGKNPSNPKAVWRWALYGRRDDGTLRLAGHARLVTTWRNSGKQHYSVKLYPRPFTALPQQMSVYGTIYLETEEQAKALLMAAGPVWFS